MPKAGAKEEHGLNKKGFKNLNPKPYMIPEPCTVNPKP